MSGRSVALLFAFGVLWTVAFTGAMLSSIQQGAIEALRHQAIERGYALYCTDTGEWAWRGECEK